MKSYEVICYGEMLWDIYPDRKHLGGAPLNVACMLKQLEVNALMISAIGNDALGTELLEVLTDKKLNPNYIQRNSYDTGNVQVQLDALGKPSYQIAEDVAYDHIVSDGLDDINSDYIVFGSLCLRNEISKNTLFQLAENIKHKVLDLNLRKPHYTQALIEELLRLADILKINDEELQTLKSYFTLNGADHRALAQLSELFDIQEIIVTQGAKETILYHDGNIYAIKSEKITPTDTVGAGDAFLAGFLCGRLKGIPLSHCVRKGNALGAIVATQEGATPSLSSDQLFTLNNI